MEVEQNEKKNEIETEQERIPIQNKNSNVLK